MSRKVTKTDKHEARRKTHQKILRKAQQALAHDVPVGDRIPFLKALRKPGPQPARPAGVAGSKPHPFSKAVDPDITTSYLKEVSRHDLLSREEELALAKRVLKNDRVAFDELIKRNLRRAASRCSTWSRRATRA
ncbi:MAG: hypothetical protein HY814_06030 [Candidatus Riflebacteria bacterium]|nr:hypothetical protein [Candidatus Riflebacteria bacterium]